MSNAFSSDYEVLTEDGFKSFDGIKKIITDKTIKIVFDDGVFIECTENHLIKRDKEFIEAKNINIGDTISGKQVCKIFKINESKDVFDLLNVKDTSHYITNNVTSHNCAFVENWDEFFASVFPTISSGDTTKILLTSTPNGLNHFYKTCDGAQKTGNEWNGYHYIEVKWGRVPGRDQKWKNEMLSAMNWDYQKFAQEFEVEWLGSSGTLIEGNVLKNLVYKPPLEDNNDITVYKRPEENHIYTCVVDASRGKGLDYSAFQVIDITQMPYDQVCAFRNNLVTPVEYAEIIHRICKHYNNATVLVEVNDIGAQLSDILHFDFEYENILYTENAGRSGKRISTGFGGKEQDKGIRTTQQVKSIGCSILKLLIEQQQLIINDFNTIQELSTFSRKGKSFEAESGCHDDMVMCLVLFAWLSDQRYFREVTNISTLAKLRNKSEDQMLQELTPFGIIDDGTDVEMPADHRIYTGAIKFDNQSLNIFDFNDNDHSSTIIMPVRQY